ncbi:hypothetical protein L484_008730 [Morus notabilis]|uniref:Uncharacterized protein n=1 Tax=Morus notabilis TaxID=981085 RepID=W9QY92_9ROSA|nr:hypothetical protein L484_008730 [Morus notabilis]
MDDPLDKRDAQRQCDPLDKMNYPALFPSNHNTNPASSNDGANQALKVSNDSVVPSTTKPSLRYAISSLKLPPPLPLPLPLVDEDSLASSV